MDRFGINDMSRAGLKLARNMARTYSEKPQGARNHRWGSVARGCADEYSDVEIGVFWDMPPSDGDRKDVVRRMGGEIWSFGAFRRGRASENFGLSGSTIGSKHHQGTAMVSPIETVDRWLEGLIDNLDTAPSRYELAAAIRYGAPLFGHDLIGRWKKKVASFPDRLAIKLVQQNIWLGPWFNPGPPTWSWPSTSSGCNRRSSTCWPPSTANSCPPQSTSGWTDCSTVYRSSRPIAQLGSRRRSRQAIWDRPRGN